MRIAFTQSFLHPLFASIGKSDIEHIGIIVPPLPEQHRIVRILDEAFAAIAKAKANAEKNLQNARMLFESALHGAFKSASQSYEIVSLSQLTTAISDGDHSPPPKAASGIPFITIGNIVKETRKIDFSNTFLVPQTYFERITANRKPQSGDVLYTVTGSFGIPVLVGGDVGFCFQRHIALIRPNDKTRSKWLFYLLLSPQVLKQAAVRATGTAQKTVSLSVLRTIAVPKVPVDQQQSIASRLDALLDQTQAVLSIARQKLTALGQLKQSLLHQAFSGNL